MECLFALQWFEHPLTIAGVITAIFTAIGSVFTFYKAVAEYGKQGAQRRAEYFFKIKKDFEPKFSEIEAKAIDKREFGPDDFGDRLDFIAFCDELAVFINSGLLSRSVAFYFYGFTILECAKNESFRKDLDLDSPYFKLFRDMITLMKEEERKLFAWHEAGQSLMGEADDLSLILNLDPSRLRL
jgi:hypothetical protein